MAAEAPLDRAQLETRREDGVLERLRCDRAVREVPARVADAPHLEAVDQHRLEPLPENALRAAAADVHDEPPVELLGERVRDAEIDEPPLLRARDDLDRVAEGRLGALEEVACVARVAQRVRRDGAHADRREPADTLPEPGEALERALPGLFVDLPVLVEPRGELDLLAQAVDDHGLAPHRARHEQVEAVGTEVHGREGFGNRVHGRAPDSVKER